MREEQQIAVSVELIHLHDGYLEVRSRQSRWLC
jgi:hypothetical protein